MSGSAGEGVAYGKIESGFEPVSRLISAIFDTSLVESAWDGVARAFADVFNSKGCSIQIRDTVTGSVQIIGKTSDLDSEMVADYETWHYKEDLWATRAVLPTNLNRALVGTELIPLENLLETNFYHEYCEPLHVFHTLCGTQDIGDNCIGLIKVYRGAEEAEFDEQSKRDLGLVLPHLKSGLQLDRRMRSIVQGQTITLSAVEQLSLGLIIIGMGGIVRFYNKTVERMLRSDMGISIHRGRLHVEDTAAQQILQKAIDEAQKGPANGRRAAGVMIPLFTNCEHRLSLLVNPIWSKDGKGSIAAIYINDPQERRKPREDAISKMYGLTPAESRLVKSLINGERLQDYAERVGISLHTAKTQLKQVFSKTGYGRQTDLVREILSNPILRMRP